MGKSCLLVFLLLLVSGLQRPDLVLQLRRPLQSSPWCTAFFISSFQRVHLAQIGKSGSGPPGLLGRPSFPALPPCCWTRGASGRHLTGEEVVKVGPPASSFSRPAGWAWEEIVEEIVSKEAVPRRSFASSAGSGHPAAGYSPAFRAVAARELLFHMAVHVAPIHKGNLHSYHNFRISKINSSIIWKLCVLIEIFPAARVPATPAGSAPAS